MKSSYGSPSSSPPSPPSPLPVSVGPGNQTYFFSSSPSPSPSPSPPFSPPPSSHTSAENLPFLHEKPPSPKRPPLAFSLDHPHDQLDSKTSCLQDLTGQCYFLLSLYPSSPTTSQSNTLLPRLEWLVERCCSNSSWCRSKTSEKSGGIAHSQINLAFEVVKK
ncbi:unnamed protein product [Ilex paraguariensis]|uniref:Uncharacterized protein n=1 Tax=Ilex paraguariensis TaxID=185542 RepID=A0ABC8RMR7_9AQUA